MEIVVDEWFLEYMIPGSEHFSLSNRFLDEMEKRSDNIVLRKPSAFIDKLFKYAKQREGHKDFSRLFRILFDSTKVHIVSSEEVPKLPIEIEALIPGDDLYLVELVWFTNDKIFITTDTKLAKILQVHEDVKVFLVDDFLNNYYAKN